MKKFLSYLICFSLITPCFSGYRRARYSEFQKPPLGTTINRNSPQAKGLVGLWILNENGGTNVYDGVTHSALAFTNSPLWKPGRTGSTVEMNGTNNYVGGQIVLPSPLLPNAMSCWFRMPGAAPSVNGEYILIGLSNLSDATNYGIVSYFYDNVGGRPATPGIRYLLHDSISGDSFSEASLPADNNWHQIIATSLDPNVPFQQIFIDGKIVAVSQIQGVAVAVSPLGLNNINFGVLRFGSNFYGYGAIQIDDVRIYKRNLTATDARDMYTNPMDIFNFPKMELIAPVAGVAPTASPLQTILYNAILKNAVIH